MFEAFKENKENEKEIKRLERYIESGKDELKFARSFHDEFEYDVELKEKRTAEQNTHALSVREAMFHVGQSCVGRQAFRWKRDTFKLVPQVLQVLQEAACQLTQMEKIPQYAVLRTEYMYRV